MLSDDRLEDDCWCLIFEEDFRFFDPTTKQSRTNKIKLIPALGPQQQPHSEPSAGAAASSAAASSSSGPAPVGGPSLPPDPSSAVWREDWQSRFRGMVYEMPTKPQKSEFDAISPFVLDLLGLATEADWQGHGGVVWYSWQPGDPTQPCSRPNRMSSGSTLIGMSKVAADMLLHAFWEPSNEMLMKPYHIDLVLKRFFSKHGADMAAAYITPPIGGYSTHISGCSKEHFATPRMSSFCADWSCEGTRKAHDLPRRREKWLATWTVNGNCHWLEEVDKAVDRRWYTFWGGPRVQPRLGDRNVSPLAEPSAGGEPLDEDPPPLTQRQRRQIRQARSLDQHRYWVQREEEVLIVQARECPLNLLHAPLSLPPALE